MNDKSKRNEGTGAVAVKPKKKKKKVLIIVLVIIALLAIVIGYFIHNMTKQVAAVTNMVEVEPVQKRDLSDTISLKGTVAGDSRTNVTSKAVSEITAVNVQVGDIVKAGDILCTLDSASIQEKITELEKTLSNSSAVNNIQSKQNQDLVAQAKEDQTRQVDEAQIQVNQAQENYDGAQMQYDNGEIDFSALLASKRALESAQRSYDSVVASTNRAIESAQLAADLDKYKDSDSASKDTLSGLKEQLADCEIAAPNGGVVTAVNVRVGDINVEKNTMITIEDTSALKMVATVSESEILKIEEGMSAVVTSDATGEEEIKGTVSRVVRVKSEPSSTGNNTTAGGYSVEIALDNTTLLVGMETKAKVMLKEKGECLAIPYDLVQYDESGNAFVFVAETNSDGSATAVKKMIEVGEEIDYYTEITGGDLKEGDQLIYDYTFQTVEGQTFTADQMYSGQDLGMTGGEAGSSGTSVNVEVVE